jgi:putative endonuclease
MIKKRDFGNIGEDYAADYLVKQGYTVLERNWTTGHKEIDLIAMHEDILIFVEVKTRRSSRFGHPEEAVSEKKAQLIVTAAQEYMQHCSIPYKDIRFDIIALILEQGVVRDFLHLRDAFY